MDFFEDPDIIDLAEEHAREVLDLSDSESTRILKAYKRVRQDLRDRLDALPSGTFTAQRMRSTLVQIDAALKAMGADMMDGMSSAGQSAAELGVGHLIDEIAKWDEHFLGAVTPLDIDIVKSATDTNKLLVNNYQSSMSSYSSSIRGKLAQGISDGVIAQRSTGEILQDIGKTMLGEQWRLERIVRTEVMGIYSRGKLNAMSDAQDDVPGLMKTLYNPMDNRTAADSKYVEREVEAGDTNLIVPVDEYFKYKWKGAWREYMAPPDRPNDRSILIPYRKAWAK
jgi:hypothetical protein